MVGAPATNVVDCANRPIAPPCVVMFVSQSVVTDPGTNDMSVSTSCVRENARRYRFENQTFAGDGLVRNVKCASSVSSRHWPGLKGCSGGLRRVLCSGSVQLPCTNVCIRFHNTTSRCHCRFNKRLLTHQRLLVDAFCALSARSMQHGLWLLCLRMKPGSSTSDWTRRSDGHIMLSRATEVRD